MKQGNQKGFFNTSLTAYFCNMNMLLELMGLVINEKNTVSYYPLSRATEPKSIYRKGDQVY